MDIFYDAIDFSMQIFHCVLRKCTPSWSIEKAQIRFHDLTLLIEGEVEYIIDGVSYKASAGDLIYVPIGSVREAFTSPQNLMKCYCFNFRLWDLKGNNIFLPFSTISHVGMQPDILSLYKQASQEWDYHFPGYKSKVQGLFYLIINRFYGHLILKKNLSLIDERIQEVIRYLNDHFSERIQIKDVAAHLNMSPVYLGTLFKQTIGMSFHRYLLDIRLSSAENILLGGKCIVKEVALLCGFYDAYHLSKEYKKSRGVPPSSLLRPPKIET